MMTILEKTVVLKTLVITDIINQIQNFQTDTTDGDFIMFVQPLKIIKLDLELLAHIEEMENILAIEEIETRLPDNIKKDWGSIVKINHEEQP